MSEINAEDPSAFRFVCVASSASSEPALSEAEGSSALIVDAPQESGTVPPEGCQARELEFWLQTANCEL